MKVNRIKVNVYWKNNICIEKVIITFNDDEAGESLNQINFVEKRKILIEKKDHKFNHKMMA